MPIPSLLRDRRGTSHIQMIILTVGIALGGVAAIKVLASGLSARSDCAGQEIKSMAVGGTPCSDNGKGDGKPQEPQQPPPQDDGSDENDEEANLLKELIDFAADLIGFTDAKKCILEGDIVACIFTALNFTPGKIFGVGFKLLKNAKKIKKLVDRLLAARKAKKGEKAAEECASGKCDKPGVCFAPGTPVQAEGGLVPIEELRPGDRVWSRDDQTGEEGYRPIARTFVTPDQPLLAVTLEDAAGAAETFDVTPPHPFQVEGRGWVAAGDLEVGDEIASADGRRLRVAAAAPTGQVATVYNVEVEELHTYFVGESGAWVHNDCKDKGKDKDKEKPKKDKKTGEKCKGDGDCATGHCHSKKNGDQVCVDCTAKEISNFGGIKDRFCKNEPRGCSSLDPGSSPLGDFQTRINNGTRCIDSRNGENNRCFRGGDPGHIQAVTEAEKARRLCQCLADVAKIASQLDARAIQRATRDCKN